MNPPGMTPGPLYTSVHHAIHEAEVWQEAKRLERILDLAGEDTSGLDLEGLAQQTLVRDLKDRLTQHGVGLPWMGNPLTGDLEITCHVATDTDAVWRSWRWAEVQHA